MKLHLLNGYIQTILLAEYPDKLLLLDGCSRADVSYISHYITNKLKRPLTHLQAVVVTHMHPDHAGAAHKLRKLTGCNIISANVDGHWYQGVVGKLMHITDILLTRWVANKKKKKQRWLWYSSTLKADIKLNDGEKIPNFTDWQAFFTPGHTDRDLSLFHLPSGRLYIADLIVATRKKLIPPFPIFYPKLYQQSLQKIANVDATSFILAHGGERQINQQQFAQLLTKVPKQPITHWRVIKAKLKTVFG